MSNTIVRTAYDLERKYNLSDLAGLKKTVEQSANGLIKIDNELNRFVKETVGKIDELQDQVDGNITTWFFNGVPTKENQPANEWVEEKEQINHLGDLYYDQDTGYAYRWAFINNEYTWTRIVDADVTEALSVANSAKDTADSKRRTFVTQPTPPYDYGDIWFYNEELYRCQRSKEESGSFEAIDWIKATKYTDDTTALSIKDTFEEFQEEVVKDYVKTAVFEQTTNGFNTEVSSLRVLANEKSKIFKEQPTPPYNIGDIYIENGTKDGSNVFTCINAKLDGEYDRADWELNLKGADYVTSTTLQQTANDWLFKMRTEISDADFAKTKDIEKYIQFKDGNIILGAENSSVVAVLSNEGLYFVPRTAVSQYKTGYIAYFDSETLLVKKTINLESVTIGEYAFTPRNNGSLSFGKGKKRGGINNG